MDLILINEEKLKIILTGDDMKKLNISAEELDYSNVSTKRALWEILDKAKQNTGFDADKSKLYVQVFPDTDGGCEMFVTKVQDNDYEGTRRRNGKTFRIVDKNPKDKGIFLILSFEELCELCKRLAETSPFLHTSLFYDYSGVYIFFIKRRDHLPAYISKQIEYMTQIPEFVSEYGEARAITDRAIAYAEEHCKKISDGNAAMLLSKL